MDAGRAMVPISRGWTIDREKHTMQRDKQFRVTDRWALASDGLQWVLQHKNGKAWQGTSFVKTTKAVLARCMREKGVPANVAEVLLDGLPNCFDAG
jgi:hypothetical protein